METIYHNLPVVGALHLHELHGAARGGLAPQGFLLLAREIRAIHHAGEIHQGAQRETDSHVLM
jgi:hypothetical protein